MKQEVIGKAYVERVKSIIEMQSGLMTFKIHENTIKGNEELR